MGKFIIFVFAVLASAAAGTAYFFKVEEKRAQLTQAVEKLAEIKSLVARKAVLVIPKKQENQDLQAKIDTLTKVTAQNEMLAGQIPALEATLSELTQEFIDAVSKIRAASIGVALPDVTLASGQVLQGVRIVKITDTELTLAHNGGSARVAGSNLPADLRDRFRIDMSPMVGSPGALAASGPAASSSATLAPGSSPPPASIPAVVASTGTSPGPAGDVVFLPPAVELTQAQRNKVDAAEASLREHHNKETELRRTRGAYLAQVHDYSVKDERARFMGQPPKYQKVIPQITKAINDLDEQLAQNTAKIVDLEKQVTNIKEGRAP
jgi:hypothetical protein